MKIEFDPQKDALNIEKHGISLSRANDFELSAVFDDDRRDYGERRRRAYGLIDGETYYLAYTIRDDRIRAISLRRTHARSSGAMSDDPRFDDNPDWTEADFAKASGPETLSAAELAAFPRTRVRGTQATPTKRPISLRVDADILDSYRATGPGWQGRMNDALRKSMPG